MALNYTLQYSNTDLSADFPGHNLSGVCYAPHTNTWWMISNDSTYLVEYSIAANGVLTKLRTVIMSNGDDTEDLCFMFVTGEADNEARFAVAHEGTTGGESYLTEVLIDDNTTTIDFSSDTVKTCMTGINEYPTVNGNGVEGVDYDLANDCFYFCQEYEVAFSGGSYQHCGSIYKYDRGLDTVTEIINHSLLSGYITSCNALRYNPINQHIYIDNGPNGAGWGKVLEVEIDGTYVDLLDYSASPNQPEGLAFSEDFGVMVVNSEPEAYYFYTNDDGYMTNLKVDLFSLTNMVTTNLKVDLFSLSTISTNLKVDLWRTTQATINNQNTNFFGCNF